MTATTKPKGLAKIWREVKRPFKKVWREIKRPVRQARRLFQAKEQQQPLVLSQPVPQAQSVPQVVSQSVSTVPKFQPPVPTIPWTGQTRDPLVFTQQQRELLHPLTYQLNVLSDATGYIDFRDKTVLEIGGSNLPHDLVFGILGAKKWICINMLEGKRVNDAGWFGATSDNIYPLNHPDSKGIIHNNDYVIFDGSATEIGEELYEEFDACVSICAFEHIHGLHKAVDGIYRSLKNHGIFHTNFGPIWSGDVGHHFWIDPDKYHFSRSGECHVPPFAHLLYSAPEIDKLLAPYYMTEEEIRIKNRIVEQCTKYTTSNRLFYEDFFGIMKDSVFQNVSIMPYWGSVLDESTWLRLCRLYPTYRAFSVSGVRIVAQKQNS